MARKNSVETQYSIYKIDIEKVENVFEIKKKCDDENRYKEIISSLIKDVEQQIKSKNHDKIEKVVYDDFFGLIFRTVHMPVWKGFAKQILNDDNDHEEFLKNMNVSYVLFYYHVDSIYALTGGYGNNYIRKFIIKNFGLNLLPKMLDQDSAVIKNLTENNLTGNRISTVHVNRNNTSFDLEKNNGIYKELNVELDLRMMKDLGITFDDEKDLKIYMSNKDSLIIKKSFSLEDIKSIINNINSIEKNKDKFALNYLIPIEKVDLKKQDLDNCLIELLQSGNYDNFILIGEDQLKYYIDSHNYCIKNETGTYLKTNTPITISYLFKKINEDGYRMTKSFLKKLLKKWTLCAFDDNGKPTMPLTSIFEALQGFIEYGDYHIHCYLIGGKWCVFDSAYDQILLDEYKNIFTTKEKISKEIKRKFNLIREADCEDKYNRLFYSDENIIVAHTVLEYNIEFSDLIFWDEENLYLMHNKDKFNGIGARDVSNQISTAAQYLRTYSQTTNYDNFLKKYYNDIKRKYSNTDHIPISQEKFISLFHEKKIHFIAGYLKQYKKDTRSRYSIYLTVKMYKELNELSMGFTPLGIH